MQTDIRTVRASEESARAFVYRVLSAYIREMFLHPGEKLADRKSTRLNSSHRL